MIKILFCLVFAATIEMGFAQTEKLHVVVIGAHPDDADLLAGGTAIRLSRLGHEVLFVSLTNGDAGHYSTGGGALAKIRRAEAEEAGKRFGVTYRVLDNHDGELKPDLSIRLDVIRLIREWNDVPYSLDENVRNGNIPGQRQDRTSSANLPAGGNHGTRACRLAYPGKAAMLRARELRRNGMARRIGRRELCA